MTARVIKADRRALEVARAVHRMAESEQTILFGSRARGDHRPDSDIDVLIIKDPSPPEDRIIPDDAPMPGEEHRYLTEFGGAALYSHERLPLDKAAIARDVPQAVASRLQSRKSSNPGNPDSDESPTSHLIPLC